MRKRYSFFYYISLLLFILSSIIPVIPNFVQWVACGLAISYLILEKPVVYRFPYIRWLSVFLSFCLISCLWALKIKIAGWVLILQLLPQTILLLATFKYLTLNQNPRAIYGIICLCSVVLFIIVTMSGEAMKSILYGERFGSTLNDDFDEQVWNSNDIALALCYAIFAGYILIIKNKKPFIIRCIYYVVSIAYIALIFLTGCRKALVLLVIPVFVTVFRNSSKGFIKWIPVIALLCYGLYYVVMKIPVFYEVIGSRMEDLFNILTGNDDGTEDSSRALLIEYGWGWFLERPILGVGINNFRVLSDQTTVFAGKNFYAHNNYIELLVDVGIIGFLLYYSFVIKILKSIRGIKTSNSNISMILIVFILFLSVALVGYYDFFFNLMILLAFYYAQHVRTAPIFETSLTNKQIYENN